MSTYSTVNLVETDKQIRINLESSDSDAIQNMKDDFDLNGRLKLGDGLYLLKVQEGLKEYCYKGYTEALSLFRKYFCRDDEAKMSMYSVSTETMVEVMLKVNRRRVHYLLNHDIDWEHLKEAASTCYWITRLKPIVRMKSGTSCSHKADDICEKFGLAILLAAVTQYRKEHDLPLIDFLYKQDGHETTTLHKDLLYFLRNRTTTQESVLAIAESLAKSFPFGHIINADNEVDAV